MSLGIPTTAGTSITYRCNVTLSGCANYTFKVVYETSKYADGKAKGIITATDGS